MAELRLPQTPDDDLHILADPDRERVVPARVIPSPVYAQPTQTVRDADKYQHPQIPDVIPPDVRRKLRDLVMKSKDPRKSLEIFRSRKPTNLFDFGKSSPNPFFCSTSPVVSPPHFIAMDESVSAPVAIPQTPRVIHESFSVAGSNKTTIADPTDAAPAHATPILRSPARVNAYPLSNLMNQPAPQSIHPPITRFFEGSNHRIKRARERAIKHVDVIKDYSLSPLPSAAHQKSLCGLYLLLMAEQSNLVPTSANQKATPPPPGGEGSTIAGEVEAMPTYLGRRCGKEMVHELGTEEEKKALVVNMKKARGAARGRFLAVGVFLSVLLITSKNLIESMRKKWRIRGHLDTNQLADRRFVLEFSEEGDFIHVTKGGPWSYRDDAVLIEELKEGVDPETVQFTTIPIWAQFKNIPFYLLSKKLAREMGNKIGKLICIDNHSRGDICNKFIRARVHLPIDKALQRWIPIVDEVTDDDDDEVVDSVFYERLPNFCLLCGIIGHKDTNCNISSNMRRKRYGPELGVRPIHKDDPRCWFLPETTGQVRQQHTPELPWRTTQQAPSKPAPEHHQAIVAHVANEVGKLSVDDQPTSNAAPPKTADNTDDNTNLLPAPHHDLQPVSAQACITISPAPAETLQLVAATTEGAAVEASPSPKGKNKSAASWKRIQRKGGDVKDPKTLTTQGCSLGAPRVRPEEEGEDHPRQPSAKRILMSVPSLELCLGKENLAKLRDGEDMDAPDRGSHATGQEAQGGMEDDVNKEEEEATSLGAAGTLTGAKERACQEP
ncbi:uncharacterized protein [Lolium perenne]|uniref:uncharacterized protein n=1 Tax=Lolium perenne TaxID=4522 RepID=UPI0021F5A567|nr:uncharacterized protein LOC127312528 [Lolium perenne]